jgi:hypothetical protein
MVSSLPNKILDLYVVHSKLTENIEKTLRWYRLKKDWLCRGCRFISGSNIGNRKGAAEDRSHIPTQIHGIFSSAGKGK